jgi:7-alpha-hydroxysteroid dehydrogenase
VNAVAPGAIATSALELVTSNDELRAKLEEIPLLRRVGSPADIAATVLWLCSPAGSYVTGKVIDVDGGLDRPNLELGLPDL